ncbi:MAG: class I SAM-dependent methyltransferase [Spongiibacteraceae bacterium]
MFKQMSSTALYTDLSRYYDLMCADINYSEQSEYVRRVNQIFGNGGKRYLDLGCGTGPHVRHFLDFGFECSGLDIHAPMLDIAQQRNPEAHFFQGDMSSFTVAEPLDLITTFLYSIHYNLNIAKLAECIASVHAALSVGGIFCFNAVDKSAITNKGGVRHSVAHEGSEFIFSSSWYYAGQGDEQQLRVRIEKTTAGSTEIWQDEHQMVAVSFPFLRELLERFFEVHVFEHIYDCIEPWAGSSGNAIFVCVKT